MTTIAQGTIKRIHVDRHVIKYNATNSPMKPPVTVQTSKGAKKCWGVKINGVSTMVYMPHKPLKCGAKLWVQTTAEVELLK